MILSTLEDDILSSRTVHRLLNFVMTKLKLHKSKQTQYWRDDAALFLLYGEQKENNVLHLESHRFTDVVVISKERLLKNLLKPEKS